MIDIVAWVGVGLAACLAFCWLLAWLIAMIRSDFGRSVLLGLLIVGIFVWGVLGFAWLVFNGVTS